jgi:hypothetical protein
MNLLSKKPAPKVKEKDHLKPLFMPVGSDLIQVITSFLSTSTNVAFVPCSTSPADWRE